MVDGLQGLCRRINVGMRGGEWPDDGFMQKVELLEWVGPMLDCMCRWVVDADIVCVGMVDFPRCLCVTYSRGIAGTVDLVKNILEGMFDGRQWGRGDNVM